MVLARAQVPSTSIRCHLWRLANLPRRKKPMIWPLEFTGHLKGQRLWKHSNVAALSSHAPVQWEHSLRCLHTQNNIHIHSHLHTVRAMCTHPHTHTHTHTHTHMPASYVLNIPIQPLTCGPSIKIEMIQYILRFPGRGENTFCNRLKVQRSRWWDG